MKKIFFILLFVLVSTGLFIVGCGQMTSQTSSSSTHQLTGTLSLKAGSLSIKDVPTVTAIVAVASDGRATLATLSAGVFSISVPTGQPVLLGFYNGTTLVGYLKQKDVDWDSLPLMNPSSAPTSLGTVDVTGGTLEATPSIALNELISNMNMDLAGAQYYGKMDDTMTVLSNMDVDGNGVFDFQEAKSYLFWADYSFVESAEVSNMLGQFDENYQPLLKSYTFSLIFQNGSAAVAGTTAQLTAPGALSSTSLIGTVDAQGNTWVFGIGYITSEALVPPTGTYSAVVNNGVGTLTFNNFKPSTVSSVGAVNDIIYPVLKLVTNESTGVITGIYYKWKIIENGTARNATTGEVQSVIEDTAISKPAGFIHGSPFIELLDDSTGTTGSGPIMIERDSGFVDVSSYNKQYSGIAVISLAYNLSSRAVHRFRFSK